MRKILLFFPVLFYFTASHAQVEKTINVPYTSSSSPTFQALVYLPPDYSTATSKRYPLLVFCHGTGEAADGGGGVSRIYNSSGSGGPAYFIEHGGWPSSFTNPATGAQEQFIVVSPQANTWSVNGDQLANIVNYLVGAYRVDVNRIHLTGLSAGGAGVVEYVSQLNPNETTPSVGVDKRKYPAASVVPMSQATYDPPQSWGDVAVANATPCWGFGDPVNDVHGDETMDYVAVINKAKSGYARFTTFNTGHGPWSPFYNPSYTQSFTWNGKTANYSIYSWMLANSRGGTSTPPTQAPPVANAGSALSITLPVSSVTLSSGASTGTITSYSWTKVSGPSGGSIISPTAATTSVAGLVTGTYVFRLTLNGGSTATVQVTVHAAAATVVANAGSATSITLPTNTVTLSGGLSVGNIISIAWTKVSGPSAGTIASPTALSTSVTGLVQGTYVFQLKLNGLSLATVQITVNPAAVVTTPPPVGANKTIMVALYGGSNAYNNSQWNSWNVNAAYASPIFKYSDGSTSTVKATLSINESVTDNGASYGGGMAPAPVLRYTSFCEVARSLVISGLTASKTYALELYASRSSNQGNYTVFTIGQASSTINTYNNLNSKAPFSGLKADAQGRITVNITTPQSYNYINGFTLTETTATTSSLEMKTAVTADAQQLTPLDAAATTMLAPAFTIYPNPVRDNFTLQLNDPHLGNMKVLIVNPSGSVQHTYQYVKDQPTYTLNVSAGDLPSGVYFITVQIGNWKETKKILKL